jgi:hypothetical protein
MSNSSHLLLCGSVKYKEVTRIKNSINSIELKIIDDLFVVVFVLSPFFLVAKI